MYQALKNFMWGSNNKIINKTELRSLVELTSTAISKSIVPSLEGVYKSKEFLDTPNIVLIENLGMGLGIGTTDPRLVISSLIKFFKAVSSEKEKLIDIINTSTNDKIFSSMATAQEVAIMKTAADISSVTLFTLDLLYYIMVDNDTHYPKKRLEVVRSSIPMYSSIINVYIKDFSKHVDGLTKVAKTVIKKDVSSAMMDKLLAKHGRLIALPLINGFIGNPIYHVRLWLVDRDVDKYEALKEKKKLVELKLFELNLRSQGRHDKKLDKQIKGYEDKISGMEYDIRELSE